MWDYLAGNILRICSDDMWTTAKDDFSAANPAYLYGNKRVGPMRIRQVRVPAVACNSYFLQSMLSADDQAKARYVLDAGPDLNCALLPKDSRPKRFQKRFAS